MGHPRVQVAQMRHRRFKKAVGLFLAILMVLFNSGVLPAASATEGLLHDASGYILQIARQVTGVLANSRDLTVRAAGRLSAALSHLTAARIYMDTGSHVSLQPAGQSDSSPYRWAIWSSNNQQVAAVDQSGQVTAFAIGVAIIAAQSDLGSYLKICTVYVSQPASEVADGTYLIEAGSSGRFLTAGNDQVGSAVMTENYDLFKYQSFRLENIGSNRFRIRAARSTQGLQLTMNADSQTPAAGMEIDLMTDSAGWTRQIWTVTEHWNGSFSIISEEDPQYALSSQSGAAGPAAVTLERFSPAFQQNQHWRLSPVSPVFAQESSGCWPLASDLPLTVWMWPVPSTTAVSGSQPANAFNYSTIDIQAADFDDTGALVIAAQSGHVVFRGLTGTYGMAVVIQSEINGLIFYTFYGSLITHYIPAWINIGSYVHKGDIIGRIGATEKDGSAHLAFGIKTGGTGDTNTGSPVDPLARIFKWNYYLAAPELSLEYTGSLLYRLHIAAAGMDQSKLYLTVTIIACSGTSTDASACIAGTVYSRLPVIPGDMDLQIRATGLVALSEGQKYVVLSELEDLATGRSTCVYIDLQ